MNEFLSKISSYNLFNYLFPGIVFVVLATKTMGYHVSIADPWQLVPAAFLCYLVGMVISRFGSLVLEPVLRLLGFVKFADYRDFLAAADQDQRLETLSAVNNTYRTLLSAFTLLLLLKGYVAVAGAYEYVQGRQGTLLIILLLVTFLFSYRKQSSYVTRRVAARRQAPER